MFLHFLILALAFVSNVKVINSAGKNNPCSLQWADMSSGKLPPKSAILANPPSIYVARMKVGQETLVGHYDSTLDYAYAPASGTSSNVQRGPAFEILTNDFNCTLNWVSAWHEDGSNPELIVGSGISGGYIGRGSIETELIDEEGESTIKYELLSGSVNPSKKILRVANKNVTEELGESEYYILVSKSEGLKLVLKNLAFDDDIPGGPASMIGLDEIHNDAETEVTQAISHSTKVSEKFSISSSSTFTVAVEIGIELSIDIPFVFSASFYASVSSSISFTSGQAYETETSREITSTRSIKVPPFTSVQVCSLLENIDNFKTKWTASAEFSAAGMNAQQVIAEVKKDPTWKDKVFTEDGNKGVAQTSGDFAASLALNSQFFVGESGCSVVKEFLRKRQIEMNRKSASYDWKEEQEQIRNLFKNATRKADHSKSSRL